MDDSAVTPWQQISQALDCYSICYTKLVLKLKPSSPKHPHTSFKLGSFPNWASQVCDEVESDFPTTCASQVYYLGSKRLYKLKHGTEVLFSALGVPCFKCDPPVSGCTIVQSNRDNSYFEMEGKPLVIFGIFSFFHLKIVKKNYLYLEKYHIIMHIIDHNRSFLWISFNKCVSRCTTMKMNDRN